MRYLHSQVGWFYAAVVAMIIDGKMSKTTAFIFSQSPGQILQHQGHALLQQQPPRIHRCLFYSSSDNDEGSYSSKKSQKLINGLNIRAARMKLEEQNTKSFLKKRPLKLPYEDARRWVQANLGPDTKEDWDDLVANGYLRTPYIPKNPEKYYTETKDWISWDHFLGGIFDNKNPSNVKPSTGVFD